jgi:hypothetical protein
MAKQEFEVLLESLIEEIESFIFRFNDYIISTDWRRYNNLLAEISEGEFQNKAQISIDKMIFNLSKHKNKLNAYKKNKNKKVFLGDDSIIKNYQTLLGRYKNHLGDESTDWTKFDEDFFKKEDIEDKNLFSMLDNKHKLAEFQIKQALTLENMLVSLEDTFGIQEEDNTDEKLKLRGGSDINPITAFFVVNKKFTTI